MTTPEPEEPAATTRERLLEAAAPLFAEHGREGVSIRDIAARAGVRHGCINYHFRSKDELYREVMLRYCLPDGRELLLRELPEDLGPEAAREIFRRVVQSIVAAETQPLDPIRAGLLREQMARPEGPDEVLFEKVIRPNQRALTALIARAFPAVTDERELVLCTLNVASQCIFLRLARPVALKILGVDEFDAELTEKIAERIVATALSGLEVSVDRE